MRPSAEADSSCVRAVPLLWTSARSARPHWCGCLCSETAPVALLQRRRTSSARSGAGAKPLFVSLLFFLPHSISSSLSLFSFVSLLLCLLSSPLSSTFSLFPSPSLHRHHSSPTHPSTPPPTVQQCGQFFAGGASSLYHPLSLSPRLPHHFRAGGASCRQRTSRRPRRSPCSRPSLLVRELCTPHAHALLCSRSALLTLCSAHAHALLTLTLCSAHALLCSRSALLCFALPSSPVPAGPSLLATPCPALLATPCSAGYPLLFSSGSPPCSALLASPIPAGPRALHPALLSAPLLSLQVVILLATPCSALLCSALLCSALLCSALRLSPTIPAQTRGGRSQDA